MSLSASLVFQRANDIANIKALIPLSSHKPPRTKDRSFNTDRRTPASFRSYNIIGKTTERICLRKTGRLERRKLRFKYSCIKSDKGNANQLQTHIWHAKRMKLKRYFDWVIPSRNKSKGLKHFDQLIRSEGRILHDYSYLQCIQVMFNTISECLENLKRCMNPNNAFFSSPNESIHTYEFDTHLYAFEQFPFNPIGPVKMSFLPDSNLINEMETVDKLSNESKPVVRLWIWADPSIYKRVIKLVESFDQGNIESPVQLPMIPLSRFQLRGDNVLTFIYKLIRDGTNSFEQDIKQTYDSMPTFMEKIVSSSHQNLEYLRNVSISSLHPPQNGKMFSLQILDPRITRQLHQPSVMQQVEVQLDDLEFFSPLSYQGIHSDIDTYMNDLIESFSSDWQFNSQIHNSRMDEWKAKFSDQEIVGNQTAKEPSHHHRTFPILIIRKEETYHPKSVNKIRETNNLLNKKKKSQPPFEGWDIVLPARYAKTLWNAILLQKAIPDHELNNTQYIHRTIEAIGLDELHHIRKTFGLLNFPNDYIDHIETSVGEYWTGIEKEDKMKSSISINMKGLINKLTQRENEEVMVEMTDDLEVNSEVNILQKNKPLIIVRGYQYLLDFKAPIAPNFQRNLNDSLQMIGDVPLLLNSSQFDHINLLQVGLIPLSRGVPSTYCVILQPLQSDYQQFFQYFFKSKSSSGVNALWRGVNVEPSLYAKHLLSPQTLHSNQEEKADFKLSRKMIGFISSGQKSGLNHNYHGYIPALGICDAISVNRMFCDAALYASNIAEIAVTNKPSLKSIKYPPYYYYFVMFQNPGSGWLRPGYIKLIN